MSLQRITGKGSGKYVELHARSAFSFLRGASLPDDLAKTAAGLDLPGLAVCDRMGVYGAPRFFSAAKAQGIQPIIGSELLLEDGSVLPVLVETRVGYQNLCRLLTQAHLRSEKNQGSIHWRELPEFAGGLIALTGDSEGPLLRALERFPNRTNGAASTPEEVLSRITQAFGEDRVFVEIQRHLHSGEEHQHQRLMDLASAHRLPLLATNSVLHARPDGRQLLDVFTCLRQHTHLDRAGRWLSKNGERHLKTDVEMRALFADRPEAIENTARLAERLTFSLADLGYEFPRYPVGPGESMESVLEQQTWAGSRQRYGAEIPEKVRPLLVKELALIQKLGFSGYFLIVADLVRFCRAEGILAQGRGSAANSAVCFCLGITAVDPVKFNVLFERFLSEGRKGWPDIDIDLPSGDRREKVIQEVYRRYGPHGAAMTGTIITYRGRSAARELGKTLNLPVDVLDRFSSLFASGDFPHTLEVLSQMEQSGLPRSHPRAPAFVRLYEQMRHLPRHLGQHSGGMIICQGQLHQVVPLENAAMSGRVVAQWDKDDCEDLGIIKVDLLGLGMMAAIQEAIELTEQRGHPVDLAHLPECDPTTFQLLQAADTIGVFQVESRAQMATLPRLKPTCFYDLVIEVAIIRPGPIQGDLAHPYLRRRGGLEAVTYYDERLKPVLERTLGIPLFQEQMLKMAMVMAHLTGDEAEELRRAMSFHRSDERMTRAKSQLRLALDRASVPEDAAERIVQAVGSFALYGFPESHAISFALLAYASAYLKAHRPEEFYCALLNNQPMGFYSAATLIQDAQRHGLRVRPVSVVHSLGKAQIESPKVLRLGLQQVQGLRAEHVERLVAERIKRPFASVEDFRARTRFSKDQLATLAEVGALNDFGMHRRTALWEVATTPRGDEFPVIHQRSTGSPLTAMTARERLSADYCGLRLTTGKHPMAALRERLPMVWRASDLRQVPDGTRVQVAGQVICRQRPGTAKGVVFVSLEDETGIANVIVSPRLFETERMVITGEPFLLFEGPAQHRHGTVHIQAQRVERLVYETSLAAQSHDFH